MPKFDSPHHELPDYNALINQLEQLRPKVDTNIEQLKGTIPNCRLNDARLTAILHIGQIIDSAHLTFTFISHNLTPFDNSWWKEVYKSPFPNFTDYDKSVVINNLTVGFVKVAFVQNLFSIIDSSFRLYLRAIDPTVCNGSTGNFQNIYTALKSRLTAFPSDGDELIKLLRLTRNTIHNNGVYFDKNANNDQVTYKSVTYNFNHGKVIKFVTWEWLIEMLDDARQMLMGIILDANIIGITDEIEDPFNVRTP
ncbi:MAG TPA: hypothetical protein VGB02_01950 [Pyrinomonadaceae bacterium]|jgi:hypothetical protein